jgi:hypothetical protein
MLFRSRKMPISVFVIFIAATLWFGAGIAHAQGEYPKPSTKTKADYYVSWDRGSDQNPGTLEKPFKTPGKAVSVLKSLSDPAGKVVLIREGVYRWRDHPQNRLSLGGLHGKKGALIEFRGYPGESVTLDSFTRHFDPLTMPDMPCGWGGISFNESSYILVENFKVTGRNICNVEVLNADHITVRFIESYRSNKHGLFTGGSFHHLTIEACKFYEQMYGPTSSHGVYISGGQWDPRLPPVRDVVIRYVESYFNGRHGIQLNGRIENIIVDHCNLHHNVLGGLSLIGTRKVSVHKNLIYKNNKQGIILFTYFDTAYWDPNDPKSLAHWKATHWTIEDVYIKNNTIFMDDIPWYDDEWINYNPTWHAGIYLVDTSGHLPPFNDIFIKKNLIFNHSKMVVNIANPEFFPGAWAEKNFLYSVNDPEAVQCLVPLYMPVLQGIFTSHYKHNFWGANPLFVDLKPTLFINGNNRLIDFSDPIYNQFDDDFHLRANSLALKLGAGAF